MRLRVERSVSVACAVPIATLSHPIVIAPRAHRIVGGHRIPVVLPRDLIGEWVLVCAIVACVVVSAEVAAERGARKRYTLRGEVHRDARQRTHAHHPT